MIPARTEPAPSANKLPRRGLDTHGGARYATSNTNGEEQKMPRSNSADSSDDFYGDAVAEVQEVIEDAFASAPMSIDDLYEMLTSDDFAALLVESVGPIIESGTLRKTARTMNEFAQMVEADTIPDECEDCAIDNPIEAMEAQFSEDI